MYKYECRREGKKRGLTYVLVSLLLLSKVGGVGGHLQANVQLGKGNLNAELGEALDGVNVLVESRGLLGNQVSLEANTVDSDLGFLEHLDNALGALSLGMGPLPVGVLASGIKLVVGNQSYKL